MARGAVSKETITNQILATFPGAFKYDKEIRIPIMEDGETIQIKVTLTAAKTNVESGGDTAVPGYQPMASSNTETVSNVVAASKEPIQPTAEEKQNVAKLMSLLGL
jgi:hypothetical protein